MNEIPQHVLDDAWLIFRNHPAGAKESWKEACRRVADHVMAQERAELAEARKKHDDLPVSRLSAFVDEVHARSAPTQIELQPTYAELGELVEDLLPELQAMAAELERYRKRETEVEAAMTRIAREIVI